MSIPRVKDGSRLPKGITAVAVETEFQRIYRANGGILQARTVVQESEPEGAPLHEAFTWSDSEAGPLWRDEEARRLIRAVAIVDEPDADGNGKASKGWVHVTIGDASGYQPTVVAMGNNETRAQVLGEARSDLSAARRRLADLEGTAKAVARIDEAISEIGEMAPI